jgi:hypothetical protein
VPGVLVASHASERLTSRPAECGRWKLGRDDFGRGLIIQAFAGLTKRENGMRRVVIDLSTDHFDAFARTLELSDDGHCGACRRR